MQTVNIYDYMRSFKFTLVNLHSDFQACIKIFAVYSNKADLAREMENSRESYLISSLIETSSELIKVSPRVTHERLESILTRLFPLVRSLSSQDLAGNGTLTSRFSRASLEVKLRP